MKLQYYDREGKPITLAQFADRLKTLPGRVVMQTTLPDGKWVSTVWLGLNYRHDDGPPLIFETMVFPNEGDWSYIDGDRYATEADAKAGHDAMVKKYGG